MKMYALVEMQGGSPKIDFEEYPVKGYTFIGQLGDWGAYLISGNSEKINKMNGNPDVYVIAIVTETENSKYPELGNDFPPGTRGRLNGWIAQEGLIGPSLLAGMTNGEAVEFIMREFNGEFTFDSHDIIDEN